jgi:hypothetical protein
MLYLLQCLLTGVFLLVKEEQVPAEGMYRTIRGLPPVEWVATHEAELVRIFGVPHYRVLFRAAGDATHLLQTRRHPVKWNSAPTIVFAKFWKTFAAFGKLDYYFLHLLYLNTFFYISQIWIIYFPFENLMKVFGLWQTFFGPLQRFTKFA